MKIAAIQKLSLIDYPGMISSVIFTQGCNFRCGYCHNPSLVLPQSFGDFVLEAKVFDFLQTRIGKIEGVVITGGEPTIQFDLVRLIKKIKALGLSVKLDTNGSNPGMLKKIIDNKLIDFIAMDLKAPLNKYSAICNVNVDIEKIKKSIFYIKNSGIVKQFRITAIKGIHTIEDLDSIKGIIGDNITLQNFKFSGKHIGNSFSKENEFSSKEMDEFISILN
ncbi:MAG: anaerobic ribonucleoside-triphosphate reductase activating protein [Ignavibacteriaceae bacterium]